MNFKKLFSTILIISIIQVLLIFHSCQKLDFSSVTKSTIDSIYIINTTSVGVILDIFDLTQAEHPDFGVCYSQTNSLPSITDSTFSMGEISKYKKYTINVEELNAGIKYYFRGYILNNNGTVVYSFNIKEITLPTAPFVTTKTITSIKAYSAICGGNAISDGGVAYTTRGVCWSTSQNPKTSDNLTVDGIGLGSFTSNLSGLTSSTIYYVRAYAVNSLGTIYGDELSFTTSTPGMPVINTKSISAINLNSANCGGEVISDEESEVTEKGVCWSTSQNPSISDSKTSDGSGLGIYTSNLIGLSQGTTYFVRAYATNSVGTSYGNEISFSTPIPGLPEISTNTVHVTSANTAISGGNISSDGNATITERGVCWSTIQNPTILDNKTIDGTGIGSFTSNISGLTENTTYYIKAYATNSLGTAYGDELEFITIPTSLADIDGNIYNIVAIGNQVWMAENLKVTKYNDGTNIPNVTNETEWSGLTSGGYCDYNNSSTFGETYGHLYNWYAATNSNNLCPTGWHVPSDAEWTTLINYLGGLGLAGGKMKEAGTSHWLSPNTGATNTSGFTALPAVYRNIYGQYSATAYLKNGFWWTKDFIDTDNAVYYYVQYDMEDIVRISLDKKNGYSIRCIKE